jgi:hypothetical protein
MTVVNACANESQDRDLDQCGKLVARWWPYNNHTNSEPKRNFPWRELSASCRRRAGCLQCGAKVEPSHAARRAQVLAALRIMRRPLCPLLLFYQHTQ